MLVHGNPLHIKYVNKTIHGLIEHVSEDGRVMDVSGGTAVMKDRDGYRNISKNWIQGWGQGLALAFLAALLRKDTSGTTKQENAPEEPKEEIKKEAKKK
jgi:unsaturated rhamnogalacturonyl hydrolase